MKLYRVDINNQGQRLNKYLCRILSAAPQSFVYKMLRKKNITLNEKKADGSELLKEGDEVRFFLSDETFDKFAGKPDKIIQASNKINPIEAERIVYEDENVLICHKKVGELSQKAGTEDISINERMIEYLKENRENGDEGKTVDFTPGVVNRLDRNTDGLIVMGKNLHATAVLSKAFAGHELEKYYLAAVKGKFDKEKEGRICLYLKKDSNDNFSEVFESEVPESVKAESEIVLIGTNGDYSLVKVRLLTGKSHQIRATLKYLECPIVGDPKYGDPKDNRINREKYGIKSQLLTAYELKFPENFTELPLLSGKSITTKLSGKFELFLNDNKLEH